MISSLRNTIGTVVLLLTVEGCFIYPPSIHYNSYLEPCPPIYVETQYTINEDGSVSYPMEGLRIDVQYMTEAQLNAVLPDDSKRGRFSTNPYTYGNWADPDLGYTPNRFTVFRVTVYNYTHAKVQLDPIKAILLTDRGKKLHSYGIASTSPYNSFERYYRGLRGLSGNEFYRFEVRMGHVRSNNYAKDQKIFKGENYSGLIAFDPLYEKVEKVRLILQDFILKFDEFDRPLVTLDITFDFDRRSEYWHEDERQAETTSILKQ